MQRDRRMAGLYFNPLSPCGERRPWLDLEYRPAKFQSTLPMRGETGFLLAFHHSVRISIHSPHAGRDSMGKCMERDDYISIHSPHAGRDISSSWNSCRSWNFNPLSPCGERQMLGTSIPLWKNFNPLSPCGERRCSTSNGRGRPGTFQSTLPMRGETKR